MGLAATRAELAGALFAWGAFQGALDVSMNTQAVAVEKVQRRPLMPTFHGAWSIGALSGAALGAAAVAAHMRSPLLSSSSLSTPLSHFTHQLTQLAPWHRHC